MKLVYTAQSLIDGQLVVDLLAQAGVPSLMLHQNAQGGLGDLPVTHPEVWVKRNFDAGKARRAIIEFENRPLPASDKPCDTCGEANPATFDICWRCNAALPVSAGA